MTRSKCHNAMSCKGESLKSSNGILKKKLRSSAGGKMANRSGYVHMYFDPTLTIIKLSNLETKQSIPINIIVFYYLETCILHSHTKMIIQSMI